MDLKMEELSVASPSSPSSSTSSPFSNLDDPPPSLRASRIFFDSLSPYKWNDKLSSREPESPPSSPTPLTPSERAIVDFKEHYSEYPEYNILLEIVAAILMLFRESGPTVAFRADDLLRLMNQRLKRDAERDIKNCAGLFNVFSSIHSLIDTQRRSVIEHCIFRAVGDTVDGCLDILERLFHEIQSQFSAERHAKRSQKLQSKYVIDINDDDEDGEQESQEQEGGRNHTTDSASRKRAKIRQLKATVLNDLYEPTVTHSKGLKFMVPAAFICSCLVDDRDPAVYLGYMKRLGENGQTVTFYVLAGYFCHSPVLILSDRVSFQYDYISQLSPNLFAIRWESGEVTMEKEIENGAAIAASYAAAASDSVASMLGEDDPNLQPIWRSFQNLFSRSELQWFEDASKDPFRCAHRKVVKPVEWTENEQQLLDTIIATFCEPRCVVPLPHIVCAISCLLTRKVQNVLKQLQKRYAQISKHGFPGLEHQSPFTIPVDKQKLFSLSNKGLVDRTEHQIILETEATRQRADVVRSSLNRLISEFSLSREDLEQKLKQEQQRLKDHKAVAEEKKELVDEIYKPLLTSDQWKQYIGSAPRVSSLQSKKLKQEAAASSSSSSSGAESEAIAVASRIHSTLSARIHDLEKEEEQLKLDYCLILAALEPVTSSYVREVPRSLWFEVGQEDAHDLDYIYKIDDISQGHNYFPIPAINALNSTPFPPFTYSPEIVAGPGIDLHDVFMDPVHGGCGCVGKCGVNCSCVKRCQIGREYDDQRMKNRPVRNPYNAKGLLVDEALEQRLPTIVECNSMCGCPPDCGNRVLNKPLKWKLELRMMLHKGWGVFNVGPTIPKGACMFEYVGEVLSNDVAEARGRCADDLGCSFVCDLDAFVEIGSGDIARFSIDAGLLGNVSRFFNHSCDGNLKQPCPVFTDNHHEELGHLVLFANRPIDTGAEICFDYKYEKQNIDRCYCGAAKCSGWLR